MQTQRDRWLGWRRLGLGLSGLHREAEARNMAHATAADLEATGVPVTVHWRTGSLADEVVL